MKTSIQRALAVAASSGFGLLALSCSAFDYGDVPPLEVAVDTENPTWDNGIQALIEAKCDNCHGSATSRFDPGEIRDRPALRFAISDSEDAFAPYGVRAYVRVYRSPTDPMPPPYGTPLTDREKTALRTYLDANGYNPVNQANVDRATFLAENCATVDTAANAGLTFAGLGASVTGECTGCHSSSSPSGGVDLSTAARWKEYREDIVFVLLTDDVTKQMPKGGQPSDYLDDGQPGRILANYACASSEVTP